MGGFKPAKEVKGVGKRKKRTEAVRIVIHIDPSFAKEDFVTQNIGLLSPIFRGSVLLFQEMKGKALNQNFLHLCARKMPVSIRPEFEGPIGMQLHPGADVFYGFQGKRAGAQPDEMDDPWDFALAAWMRQQISLNRVRHARSSGF